MTRAELIRRVAERQGATQRDAEDVVERLFERLVSALVAGNRIELRGLGTLRIRRYPAHRVRHPSTGMHVLVPTRVRPQFRVAEGLRKRLNDECGSA